MVDTGAGELRAPVTFAQVRIDGCGARQIEAWIAPTMGPARVLIGHDYLQLEDASVDLKSRRVVCRRRHHAG